MEKIAFNAAESLVTQPTVVFLIPGAGYDVGDGLQVAPREAVIAWVRKP